MLFRSLLVVEAEGMIADVREVSDEVPAKEEEEITEDLEETIETEVPEEVATEVAAIVEAVVEVIAPVIEEVKADIEELKKLYNSPKKKEDMSSARKPIKHNPEAKQKKQVEFREWLDEVGTWIELDSKSFKSSGTNVSGTYINICK